MANPALLLRLVMDKASDGLISVEEAISRVLEDILPLNSEQVSISKLLEGFLRLR